jgi:hypothetical protein
MLPFANAQPCCPSPLLDLPSVYKLIFACKHHLPILAQTLLIKLHFSYPFP